MTANFDFLISTKHHFYDNHFLTDTKNLENLHMEWSVNNESAGYYLKRQYL